MEGQQALICGLNDANANRVSKAIAMRCWVVTLGCFTEGHAEGSAHTYRYISSKGLVSAKQLSQTSFTTFAASTSSLQLGRPITESVALLLTHSWCCCVSFHCARVKNSRDHLHSPLNDDARISVQVACRRLFLQSTLKRK